MVVSPQFGHGNWVAPFAGTVRPHEEHRNSIRADIMLSRSFAGQRRAAPRRRAATRDANIKRTPKNVTIPATYHSV